MYRFKLILVVFFSMPLTAFAQNYFEQIGWVSPGSTTQYQYQQQLEEIYRSNSEQIIWFDLQQSSQLEFQLELIDQSGVSPLISKQLDQLRFYRKSNQWYQYDLLATDALLAYMSYAELAKQHGKEWFFNKKIAQPLPLPSENALADLYASIQSQQIGALIDAYTPDTESYQALIATYLRLVDRRDEVVSLYVQDVKLKRVGELLENRAELIGRLQQVDIDLSEVALELSYFDEPLERAIKQFQQIHGLKVDGVIGPNTIRWLNKSSKARLKMIAINAERSRIWPDQRNTIILVNVPGYEMEYWFGGESIFQSEVIVGREKRPTPVMTTNLDSVILNPTWNVPWKIMVEDIIPAVKEDPRYLSKQNIKIIQSWTSSNVIDPMMIDWYRTHPKAFPYRMRQMSGKNNALGLYKFNTPNDRAIFLHDTPSKHLFNKPMRAFSSGCVRVKDADQFAALLLENQGLNLETIQQSNTRSNKSIPLRQRIPVHIIYQTAWGEGGVVHYRDDIYSLD